MRLAQTQTVMRIVPQGSGHDAVLFQETLEEPGVARLFTMSRVDWVDMAEPEVVTLTVNSGDLLNR